MAAPITAGFGLVPLVMLRPRESSVSIRGGSALMVDRARQEIGNKSTRRKNKAFRQAFTGVAGSGE
jgi:hypothetical protein